MPPPWTATRARRLAAAPTAAPPRRARTPRCRRGNARRRPARRPRPAACARRRRGCRRGVGHGLSRHRRADSGRSEYALMRDDCDPRYARAIARRFRSRHAALEALPDLLLRQIAADEDERGSSRFSPSFQGRWWSPSRIMCTPWNTKRSSSSLNDRMPLQRRMLGPSFCTRSCTQGKNLSGIERLVGLTATSTASPRRDSA